MACRCLRLAAAVANAAEREAGNSITSVLARAKARRCRFVRPISTRSCHNAMTLGLRRRAFVSRILSVPAINPENLARCTSLLMYFPIH